MSTLTLHRKLLLTTATVIGALSGYGRGAYAACPAAGGVCTGANFTTQVINAPNATVTTDNTFSVNTTGTGGSALVINGDGAISYTDANASPITAPNGFDMGLSITSTGDIAMGNDGSVTIDTAGTVSGSFRGISARNEGSGALNVTANGDVSNTGITGDAIRAVSYGTNMTITTGAASNIFGINQGIQGTNRGSGTMTITANGNVTGTQTIGIFAISYGTDSDINLTTGANSNVSSDGSGLYGHMAVGATGTLNITANGVVTGAGYGIFALSNDRTNVTTGATSQVTGQHGILASSYTSGAQAITTGGNVTGTSNDGILARHFGSGPVAITVLSGSTVTSNGVDGTDFAIDTYGGSSHITVAGTLNAGGGGAIQFDQGTAFDNRLELHRTAIINGTVFAGLGATDTLAFGGTGDGTFDLATIDIGGNTEQFRNFEIFQVDAGTWNLAGETPHAFTVNGGTLKGTGTFGGLTVNGGTLAPGNSIGTMTVNGLFALNAGGTFEVEVNAAGAGDQVIVNGTVNITGATLRVLAASGNYALSTDYVIIDNDDTDAVTGTFGTITSSLAFLTPTVIYNGGTGNDVVLTLARTVDENGDEVGFCTVAESDNQCEVGMALDEFPTDNELFLAVVNQTAAGARQAFDALSGEIHASAAGVLADDNRYVREAIMGRLMQAGHTDSNGQISALGALGPQVASLDQNGLDQSAMALGYDNVAAPSSPMAFWTAAYGAWGKYDGNGNAATADRDLGGFMSGMDAQLGGSWRVGLTTGASYSNISVDARNSSADAESYYLGGYTGGMVGAFALRGGGTWAWSEIDTSRAVVFPGFFERQKASYDADTSQIFGELAYPTTMGGMSVEPYANLAYVSIDTDSFVERGGALASLRGRGTDQDVGYSTLGLRAAATTQWGSTLVTPHISAAWQHAFDDVTPGAALAFATTGIGFNVTGVPLAEDSALIDAGLDFAIGANTTAGVSYSGQFGDGVTDNAVKGRFTWLF